MGRGFVQYSFSDSGAPDACALYSAFLNYRMPDGAPLHVLQHECWCPKCDCFVFAEHVPTIPELESELARLQNPTEEEMRIIEFGGTPIDERIAEVRRRIAWRRDRKTPAKCLHCGSSDIVPLPNSEQFAHPKTGERVVVVGRGWASAATWEAEFTTEGNLLTSSPD